MPTKAAPEFGLRRLDWDTAFFGATMGVITLLSDATPREPEARAVAFEQALRRVLGEAKQAGYAHVIFRVPAGDLAPAWAAERAGLRLVDIGLDSSIDLGGAALPPAAASATVRPAAENDLPALQELAAGAFVLSRFSADPFFSAAQVAAFHRQWMTNLYRGLADAVLVCEVEGQLAGFVSCAVSNGEGRIPLIATDPSFRRRGVGRALLGAALRWFAGAGASVVHVKTQAHNYPALALYHRAGFTVTKTELTFSAMLAPAPAARPHAAIHTG
jgi:ribosomal protein S18 acetylase RimI-like enzyme